MELKELEREAVSLLKALIQTRSFSGGEVGTCRLIQQWLSGFEVKYSTVNNNVWAKNKYFDVSKPTILLNSHHDTVKPNPGYTKNPFDAQVAGDKLFGLGSNDAGGALVSLLSLFIYYYNHRGLKYNIIVAATAEEESSGPKGLNSLLKDLPEIDFAVVGEPTQMQMAVAEKGLLVLDGYAQGKPGHAAHENFENAIYTALDDINWIRNYGFPKVSDILGKVKMTVTQVDAGEQHNVVPAVCHFVVDIRVNDLYQNREIFEFVDQHTKSKMVARSFNLNSSAIDVGHPVVLAGLKYGRKTYGSPTLSDQSVLSCHSLKMGPGDSLRSHSADEFIYLKEVKDAIQIFIKIFSEIL